MVGMFRKNNVTALRVSGASWRGGSEEEEAATFSKKGPFFGIYKFKFYPKTEFLNCHVVFV